MDRTVKYSLCYCENEGCGTEAILLNNITHLDYLFGDTVIGSRYQAVVNSLYCGKMVTTMTYARNYHCTCVHSLAWLTYTRTRSVYLW